MKLEEFKTNLLLIGWHAEHESPTGGLWKRGTNSITWTPSVEEDTPNPYFITHQSVGTRDGYMENRNKAFHSFQECIEFLDEKPK